MGEDARAAWSAPAICGYASHSTNVTIPRPRENHLMRPSARLWLPALGILLLSCAATRAKVSMQVRVGWNGVYRVGHWTPIYLAAVDDAAKPVRNVILEVIAPQGMSMGLRLRQSLTLESQEKSFVLYLPLSHRLDETIAILRDAGSLRKLAEVPFQQPGSTGNINAVYNADRGQVLFVGVSGRRSALLSLQGHIPWNGDVPDAPPPNPDGDAALLKVGFVPQRLLPDTLQGYDGLDVLTLNAPDLATLRLEQQQAIADWVRAGGHLLMWPGDMPLPPDSPLGAILPCQIGSFASVSLSLADCKALGIVSRIESLTVRSLQPRPSARMLDWLNGKAAACIGRAGLGRVVVLSVDADQLVFDGRPAAIRAFRPVLRELVQPGRFLRQQAWLRGDEARQKVATDTIADLLGDVPGVGRFDFTYIALVMLAMMVVVGPVDWFVLRKLGRQHWTWATTSGWIVLITGGALYIGHVFRSGELHFRTLRVIDQADGRPVAALHLACIYSPRTQGYELEAPRDTWWEPVNTAPYYPWQRSRTTVELPVVQDALGNLPDRFIVRVWSLALLRAQSGDPDSVPAPLKVEVATKDRNIVGAVTNQSGGTIRQLHIRSRSGWVQLSDEIPPGETRVIDLPMVNGTPEVKPPESVNYTYGYYDESSHPYRRDRRLHPAGLIKAACDIASFRTIAVEQLLEERDDLACIYALVEEATPAVKLAHQPLPAAEKHWIVVRAVTTLKRAGTP